MKTAALLLPLLGCLGAGDSPPSSCTNVSGLYAYAFRNEQTNDAARCPTPAPYEAVSGVGAPSPYPGCSVVETTTNTCSASVQVTCATRVDGFAGQSVRIITGDTTASGDTVTGHVDARILWDQGRGECDASWDYTATRVHQ